MPKMGQDLLSVCIKCVKTSWKYSTYITDSKNEGIKSLFNLIPLSPPLLFCIFFIFHLYLYFFIYSFFSIDQFYMLVNILNGSSLILTHSTCITDSKIDKPLLNLIPLSLILSYSVFYSLLICISMYHHYLLLNGIFCLPVHRGDYVVFHRGHRYYVPRASPGSQTCLISKNDYFFRIPGGIF